MYLDSSSGMQQKTKGSFSAGVDVLNVICFTLTPTNDGDHPLEL